MSTALTPSKRLHDSKSTETNGKGKRQNTIGTVSGEGGAVISQIRQETGAKVNLEENIPGCDEQIIVITASDEKTEVSSIEQIKRDGDEEANVAEESDNKNDDNENEEEKEGVPVADSGTVKETSSMQKALLLVLEKMFEADLVTDGGDEENNKPSTFILRLLVLSSQVGCLLGKGGSVIKQMSAESGAHIRISPRDRLPKCSSVSDELVEITGEIDAAILITGQKLTCNAILLLVVENLMVLDPRDRHESGFQDQMKPVPEHPDDRISAPQDAVIRVQTRIAMAISNKEKAIIARLLVSSNQIGCLLGKESEGVVQINGEFEVVKEALLQITTRLKHHFFQNLFPSMDHLSNPAFLDQVPPFPPYMGRKELSPPFHSFPNFDGMVGAPPHASFLPHDDPPPFMHNIHRPGMPPHIAERKPWGQGHIESGGPMGLADFAGPPRRISGFGGVSHPAIITSTTIEVIVPRTIVPVIYGEDGACLKQIRQISDAKITINEPKSQELLKQ
ncbi:hypothetical protein OIU77_025334 [Salix suchowensis]|uniref:K Homology domain-containing protein n=1 Tax=Salix suchowensis TaxID=1278906 RepID=A0ABQ9BVW2_9ROSI|nr:hypothetical protein OIU77_025334 [Salix suchowensis]